MKFLLRSMTVLALATAPAGATEPDAHVAPAPGHVEAPDNHGAGDAHAPDAHGGGDAHGAEHGGHIDYLADDDHDGAPNWRDSSWDGTPHAFWPGDDPFVLPDVAFHLAHLLILIGLLWWFAARPIGDAIKNRALAIRKDLEDAAAARDEALRSNEALVARLAVFSREVEEMRSRASAEAKADAAQLVVKAEAEAERIARTAEKTIDEEVRRARATLRAESIELAVQLARSTLEREVGSEDQRLLARQFLDTLNEKGAQNG